MHLISIPSSVPARYRARYVALKLSACALSLVSTSSIAAQLPAPEAIIFVPSHEKLIHAQSNAIQTPDVPALRGQPPESLPPLQSLNKRRSAAPRSELPPSPASALQNESGSTTFSISTQDQYISNALRRFASAHGWKLSWEVDRDFDVQYDATFSGSFLEIVEQIASALQNVNTPIRVKAYHGNHVLRVIYATY